MSEGRTQNNRDPLTVVGIALSIAAQIGTWIWWGGRLDQRVTTLETDAAAARAQARADEKDKVSIDGLQNVQIAGMQADIRSIKEGVDRIERKIPERVR